jgi:hypothetical protein
MTSVQRLVRPEDIREAAAWYFGVSLSHREGYRSSDRVSRAKWSYWAALTRIGLSYREVADVTGCSHPTVARAMGKVDDLEPHILAVLERAEELASNNS